MIIIKCFISVSVDTGDVAADLAHLYGFVHQLRSLRISPPPPPTSICCSPFDINPFRSLTLLKLDRVPLSQIHGLVSVQQQLEKFTVHRSLHSLKELLIDAVEDKRGVASGVGGAYWSEGTPPPSPTSENWRLSATAKLIGSRVVVQPWHQLTILVLSHNLLTHLDDSLQVLPALKEVWLLIHTDIHVHAYKQTHMYMILYGLHSMMVGVHVYILSLHVPCIMYET